MAKALNQKRKTSPVAPVFEDGVKTVTLKGDHIAEEFQALVERYIESHYSTN